MATTPLPPRTRFHLRLATSADAHLLHQGCYSQQPWSVFEPPFRRSLQRQEQGNGRHLLAFTGEGASTEPALIGTAQLLRYPTCAEIADILVVPAWRGRGVGTALILRLEELAAELGWFPLEMGVEEQNGRALALYQRLGYTADRPLRLPHTPPALVLRKEE